MDKQAQNEKGQYSGINKILKSQALQAIIEKRSDGTFEDFVEDWKRIRSWPKPPRDFRGSRGSAELEFGGQSKPSPLGRVPP